MPGSSRRARGWLRRNGYPCDEQEHGHPARSRRFSGMAAGSHRPAGWVSFPAQSPDELAEAVPDRPRILEAPEVAPPPPALGGITIESVPVPEIEKRPGIDIPLQSAALSRRIFSAVVDAVIIASACALFGFIFWKMTAIQPP